MNVDGSRIASASEKGTLIRLWDCHTGDLLREFRRGTDRAVIYCLAFNQSSTFLACSSDKGTIHIFSLAHKNIQPSNFNNSNNQEVVASNQITSSSSSTVISSPRDQHRPMNNGFSESGTTNTTTSPTSVTGINNSPTTATTASSSSNTNKGFGLNFLRGMVPQGIIPKYVNSEWSFAQVRGLEGQCICAFDKDTTMQIIILSADGTYLLCSFQEGGECHRIATAKFLRPANEDVNNNNNLS